jgi:hypothetical protein
VLQLQLFVLFLFYFQARGVQGLLLLRVLLLCGRELLTRCRRAQGRNQIVDLQGVEFPAGLHDLSVVSLRAAAAAVCSFCFVLFCFVLFCGAGRAGVVAAARVAVVWAGAADAMPMCAGW